MLEFSKMTTPVARKEHKCSLCGDLIRIGERYDRFSGKDGGIMFDLKHHLMCREIIQQYCSYLGEFEYDNDDIIYWVEEMVCGDCEHSRFGDGADDCETSIFRCPKVIERFSKKEGVSG